MILLITYNKKKDNCDQEYIYIYIFAIIKTSNKNIRNKDTSSLVISTIAIISYHKGIYIHFFFFFFAKMAYIYIVYSSIYLGFIIETVTLFTEELSGLISETRISSTNVLIKKIGCFGGDS